MSSSTRGNSFDKLLSPLALAIGLAFTGGAHAQESTPWYIGVSQAFSHDTNVFRSPGGLERSDNISSTGVLGGLNLRPGRQHIYLDGSAAANRFNSLKELNNTSYSLTSGLEWQTVEHLSGDVRLMGNRALSQLTTQDLTQVKNVLTMRQGVADVRYGFTSLLGIEAGVQHRKLDYSYTTERNFTERASHVLFNWGAPGSLLTLGVGGRFSKGDAPLYRALLDPQIPQLGLGPVTPDTWDRKDIDFVATWKPSDLSTVNGRISVTREDHTALIRPDVHGVTGEVSWDYRPTGRLAVKTKLARDTGAQTVFLSSVETLFQPVIESDTTQVNTLLAVNATYELTGKIMLTGNLAYARATVANAAGGTGRSHSSNYALAANYAATRSIGLGCSIQHATYFGYGDTVYGCSAQFVLR